MRPKLWLTKCVVTYANMTSPEANRSRRITPSTCARVSSRNLVPCCDRTRRLLAEGCPGPLLPAISAIFQLSAMPPALPRSFPSGLFHLVLARSTNYLEARRGGTRASWVFRYERGTADKRKGKHLGLGSMTDFTYAEAKERARRQRQLLADKIDPLEQKRAKETEAKLEAAKAITFGQCAEKLV